MPIESEFFELSASLPAVRIETGLGTIRLSLYPERAPVTVNNFLTYVDDGFYEGTVIHRVVHQFIVQGGGFETGMVLKPTRPPIRCEADNRLRNERGTIAAARLPEDPHSATAQFFINARDNGSIDYHDRTPSGWGYCVFGAVTDGMEVVDLMAGMATISVGQHRHVPAKEIRILRIARDE
jgi:peptidyl-prolyl cis-trans isomerase B (cyclophilin B)